MRRHLFVCILLFSASCRCAPDLADVHVHYKWTQQEVTSRAEAVRILGANDIALAVVIGMPAEYALELRRLAPEIIVPVWSPYRQPADRWRWPFDEELLARARRDLAGGDFFGIGELHLIGGFAPHWRTPVISGLMELARHQKIPVLLHTEMSGTRYMAELCQAFPEVTIVWAHAGAVLQAGQVRKVLASCPNLWAELAARDPWRFVNNPIADTNGTLLPEWRRLIEDYPDRFLVGSDPVWPVGQLDNWDEPDSGWQYYERFIGFHRSWLRQLAPEVSAKVRIGNARKLFGKALSAGNAPAPPRVDGRTRPESGTDTADVTHVRP